MQKKKHLLNENEGEILISGIQLADGYFENKKDIGKFFFHKNRKLYRTGDYAIKRKGEIFFKNRLDTQVKIKGHRIELDEKQSEAINRCCDLTQRIVPITGAAGTGKTTILENVYRNLYKQGSTVVLCAPTGKAAKRITEATGIKACTIPRLLESPHPGEVHQITGKSLVTTDPKRDRNTKRQIFF